MSVVKSLNAAMLAVCCVSVVLGCSGGTGGGGFERKEQTIELRGPVSGSSKSDVWALTPSAGKKVLAHSPDLSRWALVTLAPLDSMVEPLVTSYVPAEKDAAWVITGGASFVHVTAKGKLEDHSLELPRGTGVTIGELSGTSAALLIVVTTRTSTTQATDRVYLRTGGSFELVESLPAAAEYKVLAVRSAGDYYVWQSQLIGQKLLHVTAAGATPLDWSIAERPVIEVSSSGEVWIWRRSDTGGAGLHGNGTAFTAWSVSGWPAATFPLAIYPVSAGKLAIISGTQDFSAKTEAEKASVMVMLVDASGAVTTGSTLVRCLNPAECGSDTMYRLEDQTLMLQVSGTVLYVGTAAGLK